MYLCKNHLDEKWHFMQLNDSIYIMKWSNEVEKKASNQVVYWYRYHFKDTGIVTAVIS